MKKFGLLILTCCLCTISKAQNPIDTTYHTPTLLTKSDWTGSVETEPTYPGGVDELYKYLNEHIIYPEEDLKNKVQGKVFVQFVVEKDGSLTAIKALRSPSIAMGDECIRVFKALKFKPGTQYAVPIRVQYTMPVSFDADHPDWHH